MQIFSSKDMEAIIKFYIANVERYLKVDDFEFCLAFVKSPNLEHKKMIASILRKTDCIFELQDGVIMLLSGANKKSTQNLTNELNVFLNTECRECVAYYPYDGNNYDDLMNRLKNLVNKNYKVKL